MIPLLIVAYGPAFAIGPLALAHSHEAMCCGLLQIKTNCGQLRSFQTCRNIERNRLLPVHLGWGQAVITSHMNDDRSRLLDLITCIDCKHTMKIEGSDPDDNGKELLRYHCAQCGRIEVVRLSRRSWPNPS